MPALIFDCDGVLADTERDGHLPAFNQAFREHGIDVQWSEADYARLLRIGGGKERLRAVFDTDNASVVGLPRDPDDQDALVRALHQSKTQIFVQMVHDGAIPPRPGVKRVVEAALSEGWSLAVASTSAEDSVRAVLERAVGASTAERFAGIFAGDVVAAKKPSPAIYLLALERLGAQPGSTLVVEDSAQGALAASRAGLAHLVTTSSFTMDEQFPDAATVVTQLGDPNDPCTVLASQIDPPVVDMVKIEDMVRCMMVLPANAG